MMQSRHDDLTKKRMLQAKALCLEARGEGLNLGKKISVPLDLMMEELNLLSNRGSRMFQERQKRVERFTLESTANSNYNAIPSPQISSEQGGKENQAFPTLISGKHSLVISLQKMVAKKGSPDILAPGYSGPLKEIPHEKFNVTIIPKSYCSPWGEALGDREDLLTALDAQLPQFPHRLQPTNYRCFNRSAMPFGGAMASETVIGFGALERLNLPSISVSRMSLRPNFNRAPRGWGIDYTPESNEL